MVEGINLKDEIILELELGAGLIIQLFFSYDQKKIGDLQFWELFKNY